MARNDLEVRLARPDDRQALNGVMGRASLAVETGDVLRRLLDEPELLQVDDLLLTSRHVVLAEIAATPVGFASFILNDNNHAELNDMFVDPSHWRRGIGRLIFETVKRELSARQRTVIRVVAGPNAVPFYRSLGFAIVGSERTLLGPSVPVMTKAIL